MIILWNLGEQLDYFEPDGYWEEIKENGNQWDLYMMILMISFTIEEEDEEERTYQENMRTPNQTMKNH